MWSLSEYFTGLYLSFWSWWDRMPMGWADMAECILTMTEASWCNVRLLLTVWQHIRGPCVSGPRMAADNWDRKGHTVDKGENYCKHPKRKKLAWLQNKSMSLALNLHLADTRRVCPDFEIACPSTTVFALALVLCGTVVHMQDQWELAFSEYIWGVSGPVLNTILSHGQDQKKLLTSK